MDRFIVKQLLPSCELEIHLKSNMDRFIEVRILSGISLMTYLKSNMDRFIEVNAVCNALSDDTFKIQYG